MTHRSSNDDTTTRIADERPKLPSLDELNAAYLRDNPDANATTPRPEHEESAAEKKHREAVAATSDANERHEAGLRLVGSMRERSRKGDA